MTARYGSDERKPVISVQHGTPQHGLGLGCVLIIPALDVEAGKSRILILFLLYCMFEAILYYIKECLNSFPPPNNEVKIKLQFSPLTC